MTANMGGPLILFDLEDIAQPDPEWPSGEEPFAFIRPGLGPYLGRPAPTVDFSAGEGRNALDLARAGRPVTCVSPSEECLQATRRRFRDAGLPPPLLVRGDVEDLPLGDRQFGAGICIDVLSHVRHPRRALEEIYRILERGGVLFVNVLSPRDPSFGRGTLDRPNTYIYRSVPFQFYRDEDFRQLLPGLFEVLWWRDTVWDDAPHAPLDPAPHRHHGLCYTLRRVEPDRAGRPGGGR